MWAKSKTMKIAKDCEALKSVRGSGSFNVNEEYQSAFKTKSYTEILIKAQLLGFSSSSFCQGPDVLLEPGEEVIATILETSIFSRKPKLKTLICNYFHTSAEASRVFSNLITSINQFHSNYKFIQRALKESSFSPDQSKYVISQLNSFNLLNNPFTNPNQQDFKLIHDRYTSVLHHLRSKRKGVARKIKLITCFKRATGVCLTVACSMAAVAALVIAAHTLCGLLMGPAILSLPMKMKKLLKFGFLRSGVLRKVGLQLDVAAKGAYILNRDIDTMSRLVTRLHDEIEHSKAMIQFCLDRKEDRFSLQEVVKELRKSDIGFRKQVEDLEQHVYLSLVTINRARVLMTKEMTASFVENS